MAQVEDDRTGRGAESAAEAERRHALAALAQRYTSALSRYFERRVGDKAEAADLVQDVFVRIARLPDLSSIEKPDRYLFATAASALRDNGRRGAVRQRGGHDAFDEALHGADTLTPERIVAGKQAVARFQAALRDLPERTRDVFVLRVFDGMKMDVVARAIGISKRAAEKHYAKAMVHLATVLKDDAID
jgi:RNA polymerase sigma-70 factor (ECF subfamily)